MNSNVGGNDAMTRYERWSVGLSVASLAISTVGFAFLVVQLQSANESLKTGIYTNMAVWTYDLDKAFLENPDLRPYFYDGKDITPEDQNFHRAEVVAEYTLDTFDSMLEFGPYFPGGAPHAGWTNWMYDSFDNSPLLRRYIEKRRRWYEPSNQLWSIYEEWKRDHPAASQSSEKVSAQPTVPGDAAASRPRP